MCWSGPRRWPLARLPDRGGLRHRRRHPRSIALTAQLDRARADSRLAPRGGRRRGATRWCRADRGRRRTHRARRGAGRRDHPVSRRTAPTADDHRHHDDHDTAPPPHPPPGRRRRRRAAAVRRQRRQLAADAVRLPGRAARLDRRVVHGGVHGGAGATERRRHDLSRPPTPSTSTERRTPTRPRRRRRPRCSTRSPPSTARSTATAWCRRTPRPTTTTWCRQAMARAPRRGARRPWTC